MLSRYHSQIKQSSQLRGSRTSDAARRVRRIEDNPARRAQQSLMRSGVPELLARKLSKSVPSSVADNLEALEYCVSEHIDFCPLTHNVGRRVVALVGPTGVGKTTTIAKLAARAALAERKSVALISIDHYRYGASDQLEKYADLIGLPVEQAFDEDSLSEAISRFHQADLVFIDTAGRSPKDTEALEQLAACLGLGAIDINLCLSATAREQEVEYCLRKFKLLGPNKVIVTKVDEAALPVNLVLAPTLSRLPLSFLTTGQRVPEDIHAASAGIVAKLILEEADEWYDSL